MADRERLHRLIDALPESVLPEAERYLTALDDSSERGVPEDDEPLTAEEEAMLAASREALARGSVVTQDQLRARRLARRSRT